MSKGTTRRTIRCDDQTWSAAMAKSQAEGADLSSVIRTGLREYVSGGEGTENMKTAAAPAVKPKIGKRVEVLPYRDCYPVTANGALVGYVKEVTNDVWRGLPVGGGKPVLGLTRTEAAGRLVSP